MSVDLTKPVRDKKSGDHLHYIGVDTDGRHVFDVEDRKNPNWRVGVRLPAQSLDAAIENIPEPPPKTFDLEKALRMGWAEDCDGRQWHALHRVPHRDDVIAAYDCWAVIRRFNAAGEVVNDIGIQLVNSHLDEPPPPTVLWFNIYRDEGRWLFGGSFHGSEADAKANSGPFVLGTVAVTFPAELTGVNP
jgi:hypothetical protein